MKQDANGMSADRSADLRGERCPYTFIKARLAIEEMRTGEVLEVALDFLPAFEKVPASMAVLGHSLLESRRELDGSRRFWFRKGDEGA